MLFVICTHVTTLHPCYSFALVLHGNAHVVSQSEVCNFVMYIFTQDNLTSVMTLVSKRVL